MKQFFRQCIIILLGLIPGILWAAPSADLWEYWAQHNAESTRVVDHRIWNQLLNRYVSTAGDGINRFAYSKVTAQDMMQLEAYLSVLADTRITDFNRAQQRAYWINLYNALTIKVILDNYPVDSIRDIRSGFFSSGPWSLELITIEGETLTLDDIEHRILRPAWQDPRIHYAVNCASLGCPNLQNMAYTAENADSLLDRAATEFINHPRGVSIDSGALKVSSIYDWFADDFGGESGVISHIKHYASDDLLAVLGKLDEISNYSYDWTLNNTDH